MSEPRRFADSREMSPPPWRQNLRLGVAATLVIGLVFNPFGSEAIDSIRGRNTAACSQLEASMYAAIDDYKYDDAEKWDSARRLIEDQYRDLSCDFSTYRMYTLEGRL